MTGVQTCALPISYCFRCRKKTILNIGKVKFNEKEKKLYSECSVCGYKFCKIISYAKI